MANKDFKVKNGLDVSTPIPLSMGGTGQTSAENTLNALLPVQTDNANKVLKTDGTNTSWIAQSVGFPSSSVSSNVTLASNNKYFVDTSTSRTITLPSSPSVGDEIYVFDASGSAGAYNITVNRNSNYINGSSSNLIIDVNGGAASFTYTGGSYGWKAG